MLQFITLLTLLDRPMGFYYFKPQGLIIRYVIRWNFNGQSRQKLFLRTFKRILYNIHIGSGSRLKLKSNFPNILYNKNNNESNQKIYKSRVVYLIFIHLLYLLRSRVRNNHGTRWIINVTLNKKCATDLQWKLALLLQARSGTTRPLNFKNKKVGQS